MKHLIKLLLLIIVASNTITTANIKNIALCTVATGKYAFFVKDFIESARKNFMPEQQVKYFIFTDQILPITGDDIVVVRWPHKKWPFSTMMRFKAYLENMHLFNDRDYVFACDVDAIFVDKIGAEILGETTAVLHPGYYHRNLFNNGLIMRLIEKNPKSVIYLNPKQANQEYFAGGFYGGSLAGFKDIITTCYRNINQDLKAGIIAPWHDETHLNYYFLKNRPQIKLSPSYCYPEEALSTPAYKKIKTQAPKIIMLSKNHLQMRSSNQLLSDREFVILIPSYNNMNYYQANLDSVYRQTYQKYRVVYVDDCSPDGTGDAVEQYVAKLGQQHRTTIVKNTERRLALANIYNNIIAHCKDHEIVVMLDGDDTLFDEHVLTRLNYEYRKNDIWFTYGNCWFAAIKQVCPWSKSISDFGIELNNFRSWDGAATHLRTFYAWLFKKIDPADLKLNGDFFKMTYDVAMFMPMLEMAGYHHKFIKEVLYSYNDENPLNDHKINSKLQLDLNQHIRTKLSKYRPITKLEYYDKILKDNNVSVNDAAPILNDLIANLAKIYGRKDLLAILDQIYYLRPDYIKHKELLSTAKSKKYPFLASYFKTNNFKKKADLIIFSYNRPLQLYALLESIENNLSGAARVIIIVRTDNNRYKQAYLQVAQRFSWIKLIFQNKAANDFKKLVITNTFTKKSANYVLFAVDDIIIKDKVDLNKCINLINKFQAYNLQLRLGKNINYCYMLNLKTPVPEFKQVEKDTFEYIFNNGQGDWNYPNNLDMSIYRKKELENDFKQLAYDNPNQLEAKWATKANHNLTSLFFEKSKIVNIPVNIVGEFKKNKNMSRYSSIELLELFENGYKIDIKDFHQILNNSPHLEHNFRFIKRKLI